MSALSYRLAIGVSFLVPVFQNPLVYFLHAVWQGGNAFSGHDDVIVIGILNRLGKLVAHDKFVAFVDKNNAVLHHGELSGPCAAIQNRALFIAGKFDGAGASVFITLADHVHQRCLPRNPSDGAG